MGSCIRLNEGVDIQMDVHMDDFVRAKISCMHRFLLPMVLPCARFASAKAPLILIAQNTKTCLAKQDQAVSYIWIYVIKNLIRECNFEIVNKLNINSVISFNLLIGFLKCMSLSTTLLFRTTFTKTIILKPTYEMTPQPFTIIQFIMNKYCILRTNTKIIYFSTNQQSQSRAALHVGQVGPSNFQLWDNSKSRKLRYTLVWQAKILGPDDQTLYEAI